MAQVYEVCFPWNCVMFAIVYLDILLLKTLLLYIVHCCNIPCTYEFVLYVHRIVNVRIYFKSLYYTLLLCSVGRVVIDPCWQQWSSSSSTSLCLSSPPSVCTVTVPSSPTPYPYMIHLSPMLPSQNVHTNWLFKSIASHDMTEVGQLMFCYQVQQSDVFFPTCCKIDQYRPITQYTSTQLIHTTTILLIN